jgi:hypothetical protein
MIAPWAQRSLVPRFTGVPKKRSLFLWGGSVRTRSRDLFAESCRDGAWTCFGKQNCVPCHWFRKSP